MIQPLFADDLPFREVKDGDASARAIVNRHYSRRKHGNLNSMQFCAAGENMVLLGVSDGWVFIWRKAKYRADKQEGVECYIFRNESEGVASEIILLCEGLAVARWGRTRFFTYVDPKEVRTRIPGYCFIKAGYTRREEPTRKGLLLFYKEDAA